MENARQKWQGNLIRRGHAKHIRDWVPNVKQKAAVAMWRRSVGSNFLSDSVPGGDMLLRMSDTDLNLLRQFTRDQSQDVSPRW